ncbi:MAG: nucleoside-diphosphate kinase [Conexivisphaerales archaeon]
MNRTLIVVKPDCVGKGMIGEVLKRFEVKGFKVISLRMLHMNREMAEAFYSVHREKSFFDELVRFITSGPVVAAVLEGREAITVVRSMIGSTDSVKAAPGTIRGDLALGLTDNCIHASDSEESFDREFKVIFG